MGHRDIKSTMVYLKGVQSKDALTKVNAGAIAQYVASQTQPSGEDRAEPLGKVPVAPEGLGAVL